MSSPIQKSHFREKQTLTKVDPEFNPDIMQPVHQAVLIDVRSDIYHHHCFRLPYTIMLQPISKHEECNWIHCRNCNMKCEKQSPSTSTQWVNKKKTAGAYFNSLTDFLYSFWCNKTWKEIIIIATSWFQHLKLLHLSDINQDMYTK